MSVAQALAQPDIADMDFDFDLPRAEIGLKHAGLSLAFIFHTNVVSELRRPAKANANANMRAFAESTLIAHIFLWAITAPGSPPMMSARLTTAGTR